jgi:alpha 1,2-mannosyltransferase
LTLPKLGLHFILTVSHEAYGNATSISRLLGSGKASHIGAIPEQYHWPADNTTASGFDRDRRANAVIVLLARNSDLNGVVKSLKQMEDRFNKRFRYPYVFLNEQEFTDQFKECVTIFTWLIYLPRSPHGDSARRAGGCLK